MHQRIPIITNNNNVSYISSTQIDESFKATIHSHPNLEILLVVDGSGYIQTTNHQYKIEKGSLVIINPNYNHYETSLNKLVFFAIGTNKESMLLKENITKKIIIYNLDNEEYNDFYYIYKLIYKEALIKKQGYDCLIENYLNCIIQLLLRKDSFLLNKNEFNKYSDLINNVINILDKNYSLNIKLEDLAKSFSISLATLCHKFKKEVGKSIIEYKINNQLEEAKNLLKISDMNIFQIAYLVGFNDPSYFNKLFKKNYQMTPIQYRKMYK